MPLPAPLSNPPPSPLPPCAVIGRWSAAEMEGGHWRRLMEADGEEVPFACPRPGMAVAVTLVEFIPHHEASGGIGAIK
jgi:hypothetical protein